MLNHSMFTPSNLTYLTISDLDFRKGETLDRNFQEMDFAVLYEERLCKGFTSQLSILEIASFKILGGCKIPISEAVLICSLKHSPNTSFLAGIHFSMIFEDCPGNTLKQLASL